MTSEDGAGKQRYWTQLSQLWNPDERSRVRAIYRLRDYGSDAVGPISRRLADCSPQVARVALKTLGSMGYGEGPACYWACRAKPTLTHFADFGAYLTNQFSDA